MDLQIDQLRVEELQRYSILDTAPEESFDRITRLAKNVMHVPISLISLLDDHRQWFKSNQGLDACETARDISFCTHAIEKNQPFIVNDASKDDRFKNNPLVLDDPHIRFYAGIPLRSPRGFNLGTLCIIDRTPRNLSLEQISILHDLAQLVMDEIELRSLATYDCLTGLRRRSNFMDLANKELQRAQRYGSNFSVIAFDIDHFKTINDQYGHAAGDRVLQQIGDICRIDLRDIDIVSRLGGEEFIILLPETDRQAAVTIAERLRERFESISLEDGGNIIQFTASFGAVDYNTQKPKSINAILNAADDWLYEAKANGRNCVLPVFE